MMVATTNASPVMVETRITNDSILDTIPKTTTTEDSAEQPTNHPEPRVSRPASPSSRPGCCGTTGCREGGGGLRGWIMVLAASLIQVLVGGLIMSLGVFYVDWKEQFSAGAADVGWVGSVTSLSALCSGPMVAVLTRRFGCRAVITVGGALTVLCYIVASLTTNLTQLTLAMLTAGFGLGLAYHPSVFIIPFVFEKRVAIAYGIVFAGLGLGSVIFPPLVRVLIDRFAWQGATLILGGIAGNICVAAALLRSPRRERQQINIYRRKQKPPTSTEGTSSSSNGQDDGKEWSDNKTKVVRNPQSSKHSYANRAFTNTENIEPKLASSCKPHPTAATVEVPPLSTAVESVTTSPGKRFVRAIGLNLFVTNYRFVSFCTVYFLMGISQTAAALFMVSRGVSIGIPQAQAALMTSVSGTSSIVARLGHGPVIDAGYVTPHRLCAAMFAVHAISCLVCPFTQSFVTMAMFAAVFGFSSGAYIPVLLILINRCVKEHQTQSAVGFVMFFMGIGSVVGSVLLGGLYDVTGSFDASYYLSGCAGVIIFFILLCHRQLKRLQERTDRCRIRKQP